MQFTPRTVPVAGEWGLSFLPFQRGARAYQDHGIRYLEKRCVIENDAFRDEHILAQAW